jgi:hydroxymethylglutaryl-CoA lyase
MLKPIQIIECPRDAMQGWKKMIPTSEKINYLNQLLKVGFHTLDFGSFVSPKAIPQMADTEDVLQSLDVLEGHTRLLAIIANERGAEKACSFSKINDLGFPFSVSETFQKRNANSSVAEAFEKVKTIQQLCVTHEKQLVVYLSMAFGNPYGDEWNEQVVFEWAEKIAGLGVKVLSLADTVGLANAKQVERMTGFLIEQMPHMTIGVHLHSTSANRIEKLEAAYRTGCKRYDGALKGIGGCPMADDALVGNMDTEWMVDFFNQKNQQLGLDQQELKAALNMAGEIFV